MLQIRYPLQWNPTCSHVAVVTDDPCRKVRDTGSVLRKKGLAPHNKLDRGLAACYVTDVLFHLLIEQEVGVIIGHFLRPCDETDRGRLYLLPRFEFG